MSAGATDGLIANLAKSVEDVRNHQHPNGGEDFFCLNQVAYMGERMGSVLQRLAAAEAEREWLRNLAGDPEPFDPGAGPMTGYVAGHCGHRVAESEWRAGYRNCERCPAGGDDE